MSRGDQAKLERWVYDQTGLTWWGLDFETKTKLRAAYNEARFQAEPKPQPPDDDTVAKWAFTCYGAYFFQCTPQQKANWRHHYEVGAL